MAKGKSATFLGNFHQSGATPVADETSHGVFRTVAGGTVVLNHTTLSAMTKTRFGISPRMAQHAVDSKKLYKEPAPV